MNAPSRAARLTPVEGDYAAPNFRRAAAQIFTNLGRLLENPVPGMADGQPNWAGLNQARMAPEPQRALFELGVSMWKGELSWLLPRVANDEDCIEIFRNALSECRGAEGLPRRGQSIDVLLGPDKPFRHRAWLVADVDINRRIVTTKKGDFYMSDDWTTGTLEETSTTCAWPSTPEHVKRRNAEAPFLDAWVVAKSLRSDLNLAWASSDSARFDRLTDALMAIKDADGPFIAESDEPITEQEWGIMLDRLDRLAASLERMESAVGPNSAMRVVMRLRDRLVPLGCGVQGKGAA